LKQGLENWLEKPRFRFIKSFKTSKIQILFFFKFVVQYNTDHIESNSLVNEIFSLMSGNAVYLGQIVQLFGVCIQKVDTNKHADL